MQREFRKEPKSLLAPAAMQILKRRFQTDLTLAITREPSSSPTILQRKELL
jgi:hypothetical protein